MDSKSQIISTMLQHNILTNKSVLEEINSIPNVDVFSKYFSNRIIDLPKTTNSVLELMQKYRIQMSPNQLSEKTKILEISKKHLSNIKIGTVNIVSNYTTEPKKREIQDFVKYFTARYYSIQRMLQNRKELTGLTAINRLLQRRERGDASLIAMVREKNIFKTGTIMLEVEDPTGVIKILIKKSEDEIYKVAKEVVCDEVIGIKGMSDGSVMYGKTIIHPDIPLFKELKKAPDEAYAIFIGDTHFGANVFIPEAFEKFISWIQAKQGNDEQKRVAKLVKYVVLVGDLIEGVGIYPKQEDDLTVKDIYGQYEEMAKYLKQIPENIKIIICPGNHDAMRIAEPQPALYHDFAAAIYELPNVVMVSSPSVVNIHKSDEFPGFDILLYHGFSFIYYGDMVESIRSEGGQKRPDLIMKFLLQRRHLAPTHKSTLYLPDADRDPLVIDKIPDFFATGHIHRVSVSNYRNVTLLNCSCWIKTTEFQEKVGIEPQPGRAILVNLQSRKVKVLKFYDDPKDKENKEDLTKTNT